MGGVMAGRAVKKGKTRLKNKGKDPLAVVSIAPSGSGKPSEGVPFSKILVVIALILAFLYGPSFFKLFKNGVQPTPKYFLVKKVAEFSGNDIQGKPFFVNDIAAVSPHELAV